MENDEWSKKRQVKKENVIKQKSFAFSVKIVEVCRELKEDKKEFTLSTQLLRSGTSIGANIEEAQGAQSKKDFFAKMTIAYKEALETRYWLKLLRETKYINKGVADNLLEQCLELLKIIGSIQRTIRNS